MKVTWRLLAGNINWCVVVVGKYDYDLLVIGGGSGGLACSKEGIVKFRSVEKRKPHQHNARLTSSQRINYSLFNLRMMGIRYPKSKTYKVTAFN